MSEPRCASCGHERPDHLSCSCGTACYTYDPDRCPCEAWQEPSVPEPRTPEAALSKAWHRAFHSYRDGECDADQPWSDKILDALTAAGWSLVRTPTDGDLTTALETLLSVGLHEIADPSCSGEPDHARTHAKAVELARSPLAHEMVEAAARRTTGADGLLGVANIMRRHTHQGVWAMSRFAGPDPSADCLLCRALVDAGVLTLDDIGAGTREAILQGPTEGPSCATCHHPIHHGPLACDVGMATTGGLCCCVDLAPVGVTP